MLISMALNVGNCGGITGSIIIVKNFVINRPEPFTHFKTVTYLIIGYTCTDLYANKHS